MSIRGSAVLGDYEAAANAVLKELGEERVVARIWEGDHTVWRPEPEEISNRLGWLESPANTLHDLEKIEAFVQSVREDGYTRALL